MGLYNRTSLDLLCQLIMRDNPQILTPLSAANVVVLGGPYTTNLGTSGRSTRITLNGRGGSGFVGKIDFFYDRMNIGALFNGITVVFAAEGSAKTVADLLPSLNEQYGLGLTAGDISNGATKLPFGYTDTPVTLTMSANSVAFTGSLSVNWRRKPVGTFPDSGPGTKVMLIGDMTEGYFGRVSEDELFNSATILAKLNEGRTTPYGTLTGLPATRWWYKFARDNKIFYLASYNQVSIRWVELYRLGAMYATDVPSANQFPPDNVKVAQTALLRKTENGRDWYLSPCAPRMAAQDPWDFASANAAPDPTGDVARLFCKVYLTGGFSTGEWDNIGGDASGFWMSNQPRTSPTQRYGGGMVGTNNGLYDATNFLGGWRPFLELVSPDKVTLPIEQFVGNPEGVLRKPMMSISAEVSGVLLNVSTVKWEIDGNLRKPQLAITTEPLVNVSNVAAARIPARTPVTALTTEPVLAANRFTWEFPLRKPLVSLTSNYTPPYNLQNANGDLDGFK